jgi:hypothetical protein
MNNHFVTFVSVLSGFDDDANILDPAFLNPDDNWCWNAGYGPSSAWLPLPKYKCTYENGELVWVIRDKSVIIQRNGKEDQEEVGIEVGIMIRRTPLLALTGYIVVIFPTILLLRITTVAVTKYSQKSTIHGLTKSNASRIP